MEGSRGRWSFCVVVMAGMRRRGEAGGGKDLDVAESVII